MNRRIIRGRLGRLTRLVGALSKKCFSEFDVDPTAAKEIRDKKLRLTELSRQRFDPNVFFSSAKAEEERILEARVADLVKTITLRHDYEPRQLSNDHTRNHYFGTKRMSPPPYGGNLTDAENAEEAQVVARLAAWDETDEQRDRRRLWHLWLNRRRSPTEETEYNLLNARYPPKEVDPNDPAYPAIMSFRAARLKIEQEIRDRNATMALSKKA